ILVVPTMTLAQPAERLPAHAFERIGTIKLRHGDRIMALAYSPNGEMLAAGGGNDPVRIWNSKTGELINSINEPWIRAMAFAPDKDKKSLVFAGFHRSIRVWNYELKKETGRLEGHKAPINALAIDPDNTIIASGSQDGLIRVWRWDNKAT